MPRPGWKNGAVPPGEWDAAIIFCSSRDRALPEQPTFGELWHSLLKLARKAEKEPEETSGDSALKEASVSDPLSPAPPIPNQSPAPSPMEPSQGRDANPPRPDQPRRAELLTWQQGVVERRLALKDDELKLGWARQTFREKAFDQIIEFKRDELDVKRTNLQKRIELQEKRENWYMSRGSASFPQERCTYCGMLGHSPLECPQLKKLRENWPSQELPETVNR